MFVSIVLDGGEKKSLYKVERCASALDAIQLKTKIQRNPKASRICTVISNVFCALAFLVCMVFNPTIACPTEGWKRSCGKLEKARVMFAFQPMAEPARLDANQSCQRRSPRIKAFPSVSMPGSGIIPLFPAWGWQIWGSTNMMKNLELFPAFLQPRHRSPAKETLPEKASSFGRNPSLALAYKN